ncbi:MAG: tyrosine-protein phosphatase [Saccharofermentans sp.]|nr:tyrosine-protein phosphatase [Saccharofermentans sp.]
MSAYNPDDQLIRSIPLMNARDLGGMPLEGGKVFAKGIFVRGASPAELKTEEEIKAVKEYGFGVVIDLRSESEVIRYGNPLKDDPNVEFHCIPLYLGDPDDKQDFTKTYLLDHTMGDFYILLLNELGPQIAKVMRVLLEADRLCLFHCAHGKDRTGIVSALLYMLAGASREDIVTNYKMSYEYISYFLDPLIAKVPDALKHTLRSDAPNMEQFCDYMASEYGDVRNYFTSIGLTGNEIERLYLKCLG